MIPKYAFEISRYILKHIWKVQRYLFHSVMNSTYVLQYQQTNILASVWAMLPYTPVQLAGIRLNSMWLVIFLFESCICLIRRYILICLAAKVLPCTNRFALRRMVCLATKGLPCGEEFALRRGVCLAAKALPCGKGLPCERFAFGSERSLAE